MLLKLSSLKHNQRGFTIIELIISSIIIITLTVLAAANFRGHTQKSALLKESERLSSSIREAHINALTGLLVNGSRPPAFGLHIDECALACNYLIFADINDDYAYNPGDDAVIETMSMLENDVYINDISPDDDGLDIIFTSPKGQIFINGLDSTDEAVVTLKFQNQNYAMNVLFDGKSGKIDIQSL